MHTRILRAFSTVYKTSKVIEAPAELFYKTVLDVPNYKKFIPLTDDSQVVSKINDKEFFGKLTVNFKVYKGSFISRVTHNFDEKAKEYEVVSTSKESAMLKSLESKWLIKPVSEGKCDVNYEVEYEFSNYLYQHTASIFMNTIAKGTLDAFDKRVQEIKSKPEETEEEKDTKEEDESAPDEPPIENAWKERKPGIISKMMKPRTKRHHNSVTPSDQKVDDLVISKLTRLKNDGKLNDLAFYKLVDGFCNDVCTRNQVKNLYMLEKDNVLTEVHFIVYLKELLEDE